VKILRVIARLNTGGPARHVTILNRGLQQRGHAPLLVHGDIAPGEASLEHLLASGNLPSVKVAELGPRIRAWSDLRAFVALLRITFREQPDVIHTHTAKAGTLGRLSALVFNATRPRARRALVVHTFHGHVLTGYFGRVGTAAVRVAERSLARITDSIITLSPAQRDDIVRRFRVARESQVATIPLGLDLEELLKLPVEAESLRARFSIRQTDVVFGYVGRFVPIKDLETLVAAFALVAQSVPDVRLLLAGDGPERKKIQAAAGDHGVSERVQFLGWTDELASVYSAIDVCVLSSLNEGTPVALIEAMAAGKPVVATRVGGVPDIVEHDRTGLIVPARNAAELAAAMISLARDASRRIEMGRAGRCSVAERFSPAGIVATIDALYADRLAVKRGTISGAK